MWTILSVFATGLFIGFSAGFYVHKHEYGEISDEEVFGLDKKQK